MRGRHRLPGQLRHRYLVAAADRLEGEMNVARLELVKALSRLGTRAAPMVSVSIVNQLAAITAVVAFLPLALSLIIAAPIWIGQRHLCEQADALNFEMELACFDLGAG